MVDHVVDGGVVTNVSVTQPTVCDSAKWQ